MINISNIRLGKATNSSSTHSMIFLPDHNETDYDVETGDFGWNHFTAASQDSKNLYFYVLLKQSLNAILDNKKYTEIILKELFSLNVSREAEEAYIDHQSSFALPANWDGTGINEQFAIELHEFISRPDVIILGGNDNEDKQHPLLNRRKVKELNLHESLPGFNPYHSKDLIARKDGEWWVLFNRLTGAKIRFSFDSSLEDYQHATFPELIDIKITSYCTENCEFCYQDSSDSGKHAENINDIISLLKEMQVFEVAIGGGEPTSHPDFISILRQFRKEGIVPNFSTRSLSWLYDNELWPEIFELCGGFAFSARNEQEIKKLGILIADRQIGDRYYRNKYNIKAHIHYVMGTLKSWQFSSFLETANDWKLPVTLLGYKETGRGSNYVPENYANWVETCAYLHNEGNRLPRLSIDTTLAEEYQKELKEKGVPSYMYTVKEGAFSMYIDAVNRTYGPSSFCSPKKMLDLPGLHYFDNSEAIEEVKKQYNKF